MSVPIKSVVMKIRKKREREREETSVSIIFVIGGEMVPRSLLVWAAASATAFIIHGAEVAAAASVLPIPTLIWSESLPLAINVENQKRNVYLGLERGGVAQSDVADLVRHSSGETVDAVAASIIGASGVQAPAAEKKADVVVLYLAETLTGQDLRSMQFLQSSLDQAKGSMVLPFTFDDAAPGTQKAWSRWFFEHERKVSFKQGSQSVDELTAELKKTLSAPASGPVVILVSIDAPENMDQILQSVGSAISQGASGASVVNVFSGFKGAAAKETLNESADLQASEIQFKRRKLATTFNTLTTIQVSVTPHILVGLLISLILLFATLTYVFCIDLVTGPTRYVAEYPPLGKVYE